MNSRLKRLLYGCGNVLAAVGLLFVVWKVWDWREQLLSADVFSPFMVFCLVLLGICSTLFSMLQACGWRQILRHFGGQISGRMALRLYGISQIAKYIPGNIAQFVSRQAIGRAEAFSNKALGLSTLFELAFLAVTSASCAILLLPYLNRLELVNKLSFLTFVQAPAPLAVLLFSLIIACLYIFLRRFFGALMASALKFYYFYVAFMGFIFLAIILLLSGPDKSIDEIVLIFVVGVMAYLVGFITPGAPSGIGVREAVIVFIMPGLATMQTILLTAILWRVISIFGDILFYILARTIFKPPVPKQEAKHAPMADNL
ncbi:MAG: hypothetical protein LBV80_03415 [Deltaproteobacteria bacterium]|jgi:hypothetical protein|nr:hypothetical protein [Deltaproteobacteria bacterium]